MPQRRGSREVPGWSGESSRWGRVQAGAWQRLRRGWGAWGTLRGHGPSAGPASTAEGWTEPAFLAAGSLPVSGGRPEPAFSLKSWGRKRSHGVHVLLSAGRAHPKKVSFRRVPAAVHADAPPGGPLPGQARRGGMRGHPVELTSRVGWSPEGLTGFLGPPVSWVLVFRLHSLLPKEGIWTGNQEGPSRGLPGLGKSGIQVRRPVWSRPAGSGRSGAQVWPHVDRARELCHPEPSSQAWGRRGWGQVLLFHEATCSLWEHQQTASSHVGAVTRGTGSS